jgi:putative ABC transport system permease protein
MEAVKEDCREARRVHIVETLVQDVRYALRVLRKNPGFTVVAVLTLALGIGANTAIFSAVNGILLKPLPYADPDRLSTIAGYKHFSSTVIGMTSFTPDIWREIEAQTPAIEQMAIYKTRQLVLTDASAPEIVKSAQVSSDFFALLGVRPLIGRPILPADTQPGHRVVVLSNSLWRGVLGGDPGIVGRKITLDQKPYEVIGVMPPEFILGADKRGVWVPLVEVPSANPKDRDEVAEAIVRLKKGVTFPEINNQLKTVAIRLAPVFTGAAQGSDLVASELKPQMVGQVRRGLLILLGAVGFVLLIACVNISSLSLARGWARQKEVAIRVALGATRGRIIRQFLVETVMLGLAGGMLGLLLSVWGVRALRAIAPPDTPRLDQLHIDAGVLYFTLVISLLAGILFGLAPAVQASTSGIGAAIKGNIGGSSVSGSTRRPHRLQSALVVCEIALAVVLVTGATLVARSFEKLTSVSLGFRTDHILTMDVDFSRAVCDTGRAQDLEKCDAAIRDILSGIEELPGVESAAAASSVPLMPDVLAVSLQIEGRTAEIGIAHGQPIGIRSISPNYFTTTGIPLLIGRSFTSGDTHNSQRVAIVNETFARSLGSGSPLGHRFSRQKDKNGRPQWIEIVGEVGDSHDLDLQQKPMAEFYAPFSQAPYFFGSSFLVRTAFDPRAITGAVEKQVWSVDKNAPISELRTMDQVMRATVAEPRFRTLLLGSFGLLGLALALIGVYGVISYAVSQRTHEIGIRMALGAQSSDLLRMVIGEGMLLAAAGIAAGTLGALSLGRVLQSMLFEMKPTDPATFIGVALVLGAAALAACYIPARRAAKMDPVVALRHE